MDVVSVHEEPTIRKPLLVLFTIVQVICGLDFGYVKLLSKKWGIVLKIIAIAFALTITVLLSRPILDFDVGFYFYVLYSAEYLIYTSILFFSRYTLYEFLFEFKETATIVNRKILRDVIIRSVLFPILSVLFKAIVSVSYCVCSNKNAYCTQSLSEYLIMILSNFAFDSLLLVQFMIMYTYYRHMKMLKSNVVEHEMKVSDVLKVYRNIMNAMDKIKPVCDKLIMSCVIVTIPRYMATEYMVLHELKLNQNWLTLALQYTIVLEMGFLISAPSLAAEAVNAHSDDILLKLHNDLIDTADGQERFEIEKTVRYMNARPSQYYVWRRVPVDVRLPMAIISIMTTYLIVIIQFTHLFN